MSKKSSVFVSVAEVSGEMHAARLVREVCSRDSGVEFYGFGGETLELAGCRTELDSVSMASMRFGFLQHLSSYMGILRRFDALLRENPPDAVLLVDSPGLHFLLARLARWRGVPVVYYICPQIWAWAPWRRGKVLRNANLLLPILPFEETIYRNDRVPVVPVGHPLVEALKEFQENSSGHLREELAIGQSVRVVGLLPGSRAHEVEKLLPIYRRALDDLKLDSERHRILISCFRKKFRAAISEAFSGFSVPYDIVETDSRGVIDASDFVIVASGTASLEVAYFEKPMLVLYHGSRWFHVARALFGLTPYFSLPNILGGAYYDGNPIVPEHLCLGDEGAELAALARPLLDDPEAREAQITRLRRLKSEALKAGASVRAADALLEFLGRGAGGAPHG